MRLTIVFLMVAAAAPRLAAAGPDQRAVNAKQACAAGRPEEGVDLLAQLFAESGDFTFVYNQGRCYQQNGIPDKAVNRFREYLRRAPNLSAQDRREVEEFIAELEKAQQAPRTPPPPAVQPTPAPPAAPAPVVVAEAPAPVAPGDSGQARSDGSRMRMVGVGLAGLGAVALGTGVVLTFKMKSVESGIETDANGTPPLTDEELASRTRQGERLEAFQWLGYGLGVAALAAGATCYVLGSRGATEPSLAFSWTPALDGSGFSTWVGGQF